MLSISEPTTRRAIQRGLTAGGAALAFLALAAAPARVAGAWRMNGAFPTRVLWAIAGVLRDLAAVALLVVPVVLLLAVALPLTRRKLRHARWQHAGGILVSAPFAAAVWTFGITAQEFKVERGSYPTVFDLSEGASSAVFMKGTLGFLRYDVYWIPALVFSAAAIAFVVWRVRRSRGSAVLAFRPWALGVAISLAGGALLLQIFVAATSAPGGRFSASTLGDPFAAIVASSVDLIAYGGKATPRALVADVEAPPARVGDGAALLGWPPPPEGGSSGPRCAHHPHERPLDRADEPRIPDERGEELVRAFEDVSSRLFPLADDSAVIVWQLTLESFRADDLHAMNPAAARETAPFVNGLYEAATRGGDGVLASRGTYQAGVRTAQGLGALACGIGTMPCNLSIIRDLHPVPLRCLSDVLSDAGFRASFYYGSDMTFDGMDEFFRAHRFDEQVTQDELPKDLPTGAWGAITDLALVDETTLRLARSFESPSPAPRLVMLTTLSNHSPFGAPADLPREVEARVDDALAKVPNHAVRDDRPRLLTHSYTDLAVARFFERLEALHLAERSIVFIAADHSTGESYVWGTEGDESDDAKARIPFAVVFPRALRERAADRPALDDALRRAQRALDAAPLSQNDIPALILSSLHAHPGLRAMPPDKRWHTLGGQITSPWFRPITRPEAYIVGVNGVSQFLAFDRRGARLGDYEESVFLKTRRDLSSVTPSLLPIAATFSALVRAGDEPCAGAEVHGAR